MQRQGLLKDRSQSPNKIAVRVNKCIEIHILSVLKEPTFKQQYKIKGDEREVIYYDVAVIQWVTSCHKNHMSARVITLWRVHVTSFSTCVATMCFY